MSGLVVLVAQRQGKAGIYIDLLWIFILISLGFHSCAWTEGIIETFLLESKQGCQAKERQECLGEHSETKLQFASNLSTYSQKSQLEDYIDRCLQTAQTDPQNVLDIL